MAVIRVYLTTKPEWSYTGPDCKHLCFYGLGKVFDSSAIKLLPDGLLAAAWPGVEFIF